MKITTKQPEVKPNVILEMTPQEFEILVSICGSLTGPTSGPRGFTDKIWEYGQEKGYTEGSFVDFGGLELKDPWD